MDVTVAYDVFHEFYWGLPIATYFLLTGVSAGSFLLSTLAYVFGVEKYKPFGLTAVVVAVLVLLIGPVILVWDLTPNPLRFWHLYMPGFWHPTSAMAWGSVLLTLYPVNCIIYGYGIVKKNKTIIKIFGLLGVPLALAVHGYTGFILGLIQAKEFWHTSLMPTLFLVSAMVSGVALLNLILIIRNRFIPETGWLGKYFPKVEKNVIIDLVRLNVVFIVVDLFLIFTEVLTLTWGGPASAEYGILLMLLTGPFALLFLGVEISLGEIIPLAIFMHPRTKNSVPWIFFASVLIVIGIWAMRYIMVVGGQTVHVLY